MRDKDVTEAASLIPKPGISGRLRAYFFAGILVSAPISITFYIAWKFISFVDGQISPLIPPSLNPQDWALPGFGLVIAVVGLTLIGAVTANFVGRLVVRLSEAILDRMPVIRGIYSAIKQIFHTVLGQKADAFREVVLIEYPRAGAWTLGFITGATGGEVRACFDEEMVNVFVPTTPNPTSGFLLFVPRTQVRVLDMGVEDGIKMVVSLGVLSPQMDQTAP
ncbi:hypothetical protein CU669_07960 [Paramagnetospirillum kuznetsovii]|uniref:DUF502 domain-containing protein n=1 Tax=Paramagnetospirillum kuznetsovii TaxID=2053833 RepID=A0A364NZW6_9PROT|nr:DUF502 domain-containing protein [Paramagnetospirillum kuznetsovii]RAU22606.1 hypothetical protein CU669_07960 [Paramagnetospirillum kuznetsovii]